MESLVPQIDTALNVEQLTIEQTSLSFFRLRSSEDHNIHFTGANGLPAAAYQSFLTQFSDRYAVAAADCRGTSRPRSTPPKGFGFSDFAQDLIEVIEQLHSRPVIGMGHSFGAHVTLIAAIQRPDLFTKLVLIEPASLPNAALDLVYRRLPDFMRHAILPMIKKTQQRQRIWQSRESFVEKYQHHPTFRHLTTQAMQEYAEHGLFLRTDGQFELLFDPDWEAHIFSKVEFVWNNLRKIQRPCLFVRAEHSNLYSSELFQRENAKLNSHFSGMEIPNTHHLMPLEHPEACHNAIVQWLT